MRTQVLKHWSTYFLAILAISLLSLSRVAGQGETWNWFYANSTSALDFSSGIPLPLPFSALPDSGDGSSSISDAQGNLLFYSNGERVWDATHNVMPNGSGLLGDSMSTQAALIVPQPSSDSLFFLFTTPCNGAGAGLRYNEIDLSLNAGLGDITAKNLPLHPAVTEKLTAVKHANGTDIWVIAHEWLSNIFLAYLVDANGVSTIPVISSSGSLHDGFNGTNTLIAGAAGYMRASPRGDKLAAATFVHHLREIYDFDNATGVVSNAQTLPPQIDAPYGVEFSPDGSKVYFGHLNSYNNHIDQVNLDDCFPMQNVKVIATPSIFEPTAALQLGPDGKIYVFVQNSNAFDQPHFLSIIHEPNNLGVSCNFEDSIQFIGLLDQCAGLPNFVTTWFSPMFHYEDKCFGDSTSFTFKNPFELPIDSVHWNFNDPTTGAKNTSNQLNPKHVFSAADTFQVQLTFFQNGMGTDTTHRVVIYGLPAPDLGRDTVLCTGQSFVTDGFAGPDTYYTWEDGSTDTTFFIDGNTITGTDTFWVDVCRYQCVFRDSIVVQVDAVAPAIDLGPDTTVCGTGSFLLDPDLGLNAVVWNDTLTASTFTATQTGLYWAVASNGCGSDTDSVVVSLIDLPMVNLGNDTNLCPGIDFVINTNVPGDTFLWQDGATTTATFTANSSGVYSVEVTFNNCGVSRDTIELFYDLPPTAINLLPNNDTVACKGDTILLRSPISVNHSYSWSTGANSDSLQVTATGTYTLTVSNQCGTLSEQIDVDFANPALVSLPADTGFCQGDTLLIGVTAQPFTLYSWQDNSPSTSFLVDSPGLYAITATNVCGSASDQVSVQVNPLPIVDLGADQTYCNTAAFVFDPQLPGLNHLWQDGSTATSFTATVAGSYFVTVSDELGCSGSDSVDVTEFCQTILNVPNVFSPNNDGINDVFRVEYLAVSDFSLLIFNRWGHKVFESTDPGRAWDGTSNNGPLPESTYYYLINYVDVFDEKQTVNGHVILLGR